tara:strand:+ start:164 stop:361 length:198 start_codon:yes stop_codon:yes gene_type:complete
MDWEVLSILQHAGPLTVAGLILIAGIRLGKVWNKLEELLADRQERDARLTAIEQRLAGLESRLGD